MYCLYRNFTAITTNPHFPQFINKEMSTSAILERIAKKKKDTKLPPARIELTTLGLWDLRATSCAKEALLNYWNWMAVYMRGFEPGWILKKDNFFDKKVQKTEVKKGFDFCFPATSQHIPEQKEGVGGSWTRYHSYPKGVWYRYTTTPWSIRTERIELPTWWFQHESVKIQNRLLQSPALPIELSSGIWNTRKLVNV